MDVHRRNPGAVLGPVVLCILFSGCSFAPGMPGSEPEVWSSRDSLQETDTPGLQAFPVVIDLSELNPEVLRFEAIGLLVQATVSENPMLRANALEALSASPADIGASLRLALADQNRAVRFVAAFLVGTLEMDEIIILVEPLLDDPSQSVRGAAIYALSRCGKPVDRTPLSAMLMSTLSEIRSNAAMVLGELGDPSAIPLLVEVLRYPLRGVSPIQNRIVELQVTEALIKLGKEDAREAVRAALFVPAGEGEITVLACQILGRLQDLSYVNVLLDMAMREGNREEPPEIRLAAARSVADMQPEKAPIHIPLIFVGSQSFQVRMQVASALGSFRGALVQPTLARLLMDENAAVQVAAAGSVLRAIQVPEKEYGEGEESYTGG